MRVSLRISWEGKTHECVQFEYSTQKKQMNCFFHRFYPWVLKRLANNQCC
jgi:hypothetical protein